MLLRPSLAFSPAQVKPDANHDGEADIAAVPGGLTRVALTKGSLVVNSSR